jgi:hypothetical protein
MRFRLLCQESKPFLNEPLIENSFLHLLNKNLLLIFILIYILMLPIYFLFPNGSETMKEKQE